LSLDEAYLDVMRDRLGLGTARAIAEDIRRRIREECRLTASAGVSYCKFIAKLASDQNKPDGLCVITPEKGPAFVATLPVARFMVSAQKTAEKMERLGIFTGADPRRLEPRELDAHFAARANGIGKIARGIDERPVRPRPALQIGQRRADVR
jgi:DNA polymerase-4